METNYFLAPFLGEAAAFLGLGALALAVFGLGAFGFLVGPALLDFFALLGLFGFAAALAVVVFFSTEEAGFLAAAAAFLGFSLAGFFAFGEAAFLAVFGLSAAAATPAFLTGVFFGFAGFFFSAEPEEVADASLKDPDAPLPLV